MVMLYFWLVLSFLGAGLSVWSVGPVLSNALLICVGSAFVTLFLILFKARRARRQYIVIDGSNVMHWQGRQPSVATLRTVLTELIRRGFTPVVWFDANVGYKIGDRYLGPHPLAKLLDISAQQVLVAPKGLPADPLLLDCAIKLQTKVVTNDRFRDWAESYPQAKEPGFLVTGNICDGGVALADIT